MSDDKDTGAETFVAVVVGGGIAYIAYKAWEWWNRDEDGPQSGWGVGFGTGNGWLNLNPFDKGKAGTGDDGDLDGNKWDRYRVAGVRGWRRKGIPLPKEPGGPATYQAAVLIVGNNSAIPDLSSWPKNLPVFFVHDTTQNLRPLFEIDGGWGNDARFGTTNTEYEQVGWHRYFTCAATNSKDLTACIKEALEDSISIQWI